MGSAIGAARAAGLCLGLGLLVSACSAGRDAGDTFGNLLAFNSPKAPPMPAAANQAPPVDCPEVDVDDGADTIRVYAGAAQNNEDVKYQLDIAHFARDCKVIGGQIAIRVGVEGRALIGPAGAAGAFQAPVRIAVERQSDNSVVAQQILRAQVSVPPGLGESTFQVVSQPLTVPYTGRDADAVYSIVVGLENGPATKGPAKPGVRRLRKGRRRK